MHKNLIILAAGASSRMKLSEVSNNLSKDEIYEANNQNKTLIKIDKRNKPLLDYLLYNAKKAGYTEIYIVIGENSEEFKNIYTKDYLERFFTDISVTFATQYIPKNRIKPYGTADAVYQCLEQFPELKSQCFSVCNGDNLYSVTALYKIRVNDSSNAFIAYDANALNFSSERLLKFAILILDKDFSLIDILEKPENFDKENIQDSFGIIRVSMNIFKFDGQIVYPYLRDCPINPVRNEKELPTVVLNMATDIKGSVRGIPLSEHVPDLTSKEDILILKKYLSENYSEFEF